MKEIKNCNTKQKIGRIKTYVKNFFVGLCASTLVFTTLCACSPNEDNDKKATIVLTAPTNGESVMIANDEVKEWFSSYMPGYVGDNYRKEDHFYGRSIEFSWDSPIECDYYVVDIRTVGNYKETESFRTTEKSIKVDDLYVFSDYEWTVSGYKDGAECAKGQSRFKTKKSPRTIKIDGVSNSRDIAFFSSDVKQGMIYRSAAFDSITDEGVTNALRLYGFKTDLDLRNSGEGTAGTVSPLGEGVAYYSLPGAYYVKTDASVTDPKYQKNMAKAFKLFADEGNYPIVFHCAIGRDRTGTLAAILEILLGADYTDVVCDYEMSFFSEAGCRDNATNEKMLSHINGLYDYLSNYGTGSVKENTERYLFDIGVTEAELNEFKRIMKR